MWSRLAALKVFICVGPWLAQTVTWLAFFFLVEWPQFCDSRQRIGVTLTFFPNARNFPFRTRIFGIFSTLANFVWCVLGRTVASGWMNATVVEWTKLAKVWLSQPVSLSFAQPKSADFCFIRRPKHCKKKVVDSSDTCVPSTNTLKDVSQDISSSTNVPFWVCECRKAGPATRSVSFPKKKNSVCIGRSISKFWEILLLRERVRLKKKPKKKKKLKRKSDARSTSRTRMAVRERDGGRKELEAKGRKKSRNPTGGGRFSQVSVRWSAMTASYFLLLSLYFFKGCFRWKRKFSYLGCSVNKW